MKLGKRILSCFLIAAMVLVAVPLRPVEVQAAVVNSGACGDNLTWTLDDDGTFTVSGTGEMWDFSKEEVYEYHERTWQGLEQNIKRIVFEPGVTYIGAMAFGWHENLTQVTFADTITFIGNFAFIGCKNLEDFTFPQNLTGIGQQCFWACEKITKVRIPDTVTFLDAQIFGGCIALTEVYIGGSTEAGSYVYANDPLGYCPSLEKVEVSPDNFALTAVDNVLYSKDMKTIVEYPAGKKDKVYTVPETVETVWKFAVNWSPYIEEISFPTTLQVIDGYGLMGCKNLKTVKFADSCELVSIGEDAFSGCNSLESIALPDGVTTIGNYAFNWCSSLESIDLPDGVTTIGDYAFQGCDALTDVYYAGSEDQWNAISIGIENLPLTSATIYFNCVAGEISSPIYTIKRGRISDIPAGTTVETLLAGIDQRDEVQVFKGDAPVSPDTVLTTGMTLKLIRDGNVIETLTIIVTGDLDGQDGVNNKDVEYLLWHTLFPETYPLAMPVDFDGDGSTNNKDVEYLLWHTLFPDSYPLAQ